MTKSNIPNDPMILLSFINTKLRDFYSSLDELCDDIDCEKQEIINILKAADYTYNKELNKFV